MSQFLSGETLRAVNGIEIELPDEERVICIPLGEKVTVVDTLGDYEAPSGEVFTLVSIRYGRDEVVVPDYPFARLAS